MTKLITALIIIAVCYCGYHLFLYWESVKHEEENQQKQAASLASQGEGLPGLPAQLNESLRAAQRQGHAVMREWLNIYGPSVAARFYPACADNARPRRLSCSCARVPYAAARWDRETCSDSKIFREPDLRLQRSIVRIPSIPGRVFQLQ